MSTLNWILRPLAATLLVGCMSNRPVLTPQGLHHERYGYDVAYDDASTQSFLGDLWRLDNFYKAGWSSELVPKTAAQYQSTLFFDADNNGSYETTEVASKYDLRFEHRVTAGVIWLSGYPLSRFDQSKDLRAIVHDWTSDLNGAQLGMVRTDDTLLVNATNLAAVQTTEVPAKLANREAIAATIDIANVEQIKLAPNARVRRIKLVMVRTGKSYRGPGGGDFPLLLVAALSDQPEYFEKQVADFDRFLGQIVIDGERGYAELNSGRTDATPKPVDVRTPVSDPSVPSATPGTVGAEISQPAQEIPRLDSTMKAVPEPSLHKAE
ncbi:MAG: hypothetical protein QM784_29775 [Polyangiaceae bacterium]